jgi:CBS domain-containing protein
VHRFLEATTGQFMTHTVKTVARDTSMRELQKMFDEDGFNYYPVREGEDIVLLSRTVADIMTPEFIYVDPATKLTRVLQLMVDHRMKSVPVLDAQHRLVGIIARQDIMRALTDTARA